MDNLIKTPLYDCHVAAKGKIVDFGGYALPVQYSGIVAEHEAVRNSAGIFDISHMGEIIVSGERAKEFVDYALTNDIKNIAVGRCIYSPMCDSEGFCVDDLIVYCLSDTELMIVVNASNIAKDFAHLKSLDNLGCSIEDRSAQYSAVALQGPMAPDVLASICDVDVKALDYYSCTNAKVCSYDAFVSRTGYTGEDGYEIFVKDGICDIWNAIIANEAVVPAGLGARDTLRFECCMPLYGHEISSEITPFEALLSRFVVLDKDDFMGRDALIEKKPTTKRRRVGIEMVERGIARENYKVVGKDGNEIGFVTSGSHSPTFKKSLAMAMIEKSYEDEEMFVVIRDKNVLAKRVKTPFYKREQKT